MLRFTAFALLLTMLPAVQAVTFSVTRFDDPAPNGCASGDCSLREAVIAANATGTADTIALATGTYQLTRGCATDSSSCNDLDITQPLHLIGQGPGATVIVNAVPWFLPPSQQTPPMPSSANRQHTRVVEIVAAPVTFEKLTMRSGTLLGTAAVPARGGCLHAQSSAITLTDVQVSLCGVSTGGSGGGVAVNGGTLAMSRVRITENTASYGGGLAVWHVPISGNDVEISDNTATTAGGGVHLSVGTLQLGTGSRIARNVAATGGGIAVTVAGTTIIGGTSAAMGGRLQIEDNSSDGDGGGIAAGGINLSGNAPPLTLRNLSLRRNLAAGNGGGASVWLNGSNAADPVTIVDAEFTANEAGGSGGGLHLDAARTGSESNALRLSFWDNIAVGQGGAILHVGGTPLRHVSSTRNSAAGGGSSLYVVASSVNTTQMAVPRIEFFTTHEEGQAALVFGRPTELRASALSAGCQGPWIDLGNNVRSNDLAGCPGTPVAADQMGLSFGNFGGGQRVVGIISSSSVLRNVALNYPGTRDARGYLRQGLADAGAFEYDGVP